MQAYINYLLEDIAAAQRQAQSLAEQTDQSLEDHFEEVERWISGDEPDHDFSYYCGLKPEQFPPAEKLSKRQMQAVCKAFKHLLFSWNLDVDIPSRYPLAKKYSLMISVLGKPVDPPKSGFITFEFCTCDPPTCPLNDYCTCQKYYYFHDRNSDLQGESE